MSGIVGSKFNIRGSGLVGSLGTDGQHMLSAGAGKTNVFETVAAGGNTPSFQAYLSSDQGSVSANTFTKAAIDTEVLDSDGTYDNSSNYRFTPATAGKYFVFGQVFATGGERVYEIWVSIYMNGSSKIESKLDFDSNNLEAASRTVFGVLDMDDDDYAELYCKARTANNAAVTFEGSAKYDTHFGGFKIG